ncbi:hypothetical protein SAY86_007315 [Trapa natans]|uniref:B30.2/SPRY domain-containing protein n=1 Tax=Trapa natans TaxID=22666 RepID=A0AAN7R065_TRANT|nr:hypothetical protein SAY86_007315 [Trapa natans]
MDSLLSTSRQEDVCENPPSPDPSSASADIYSLAPPPSSSSSSPNHVQSGTNSETEHQLETASNEISDDDDEPQERSPKRQKVSQDDGDNEQEAMSPESPPSPASELTKDSGMDELNPDSYPKAASGGSKKKKKNSNIWAPKTVNRKGKKKGKSSNGNGNSGGVAVEDAVLIIPAPRLLPDKNDDNADMKICLSRVFKAEKVGVSEDRMSAMSTKGYRMVRATRGVLQGAWYFEIKVVALGETGHTRLGWSKEKGDLQAPVGYDMNSYGYRDIDGCKVHKALREKYGEEGYKEGDIIGFYINLPDGDRYVPKPSRMVLYKGQRYVAAPDAKEDQKVVPGSEISFFKNGVCQGVAFRNIYGGLYYPAASMYTLPNQPSCEVRFNFGPDFEFFPEDFGGRPIPCPMSEVPYHGVDSNFEDGSSLEDTPKTLSITEASTTEVEEVLQGVI